MDFSPAALPPLKSTHRQQHLQAPAADAANAAAKPRARAGLDRAKTYDSSFFSQLASQKRPEVPSSSGKQQQRQQQQPTTTTDKTRVFGNILDTNAARSNHVVSSSSATKKPQQPLFPARPPLTKKTQSEAVLHLQPAPASKQQPSTSAAAAPPKRPSMLKMRGHAASASTSMLDFAESQSRPTKASPLFG